MVRFPLLEKRIQSPRERDPARHAYESPQFPLGTDQRDQPHCHALPDPSDKHPVRIALQSADFLVHDAEDVAHAVLQARDRLLIGVVGRLGQLKPLGQVVVVLAPELLLLRRPIVVTGPGGGENPPRGGEMVEDGLAGRGIRRGQFESQVGPVAAAGMKEDHS